MVVVQHKILVYLGGPQGSPKKTHRMDVFAKEPQHTPFDRLFMPTLDPNCGTDLSDTQDKIEDGQEVLLMLHR